MKNLLLLILLMFVKQALSQDHLTVVRYGVSYIGPPPPDNLKQRNPEVYEDLVKVFETIPKMEIVVYMNDSKSLQFIADSSVVGESKFILGSARSRLPGFDFTYIDNVAGKYFNQFQFKKENIEEADMLSHLHWEITAETKEIDGHKCYKAVSHLYQDDPEYAGDNVVVWFCPDIPFPFGPHKYAGLPGLVVELHKPDMIVRLKLLKLNEKITNQKLAEMFEKKPDPVRSMTEKQMFDYIMNNYRTH